MLPKQIYPLHTIKQETTGKEYKFRPYLVKEEKILMMAKESKEIKDVFTAVQQIVQACCQDDKFDVEKIPLCDLEILFLRLRAISVRNVETINFIDDHDEKEYREQIDFNNINLKFPSEKLSNIIKLPGGVFIEMKYPDASIYTLSNDDLIKKLKQNDMYDLILNCIANVYQDDILLELSREEKIEFLNNLDVPTYHNMKEFLFNMPRIEYRIDYINSMGEKRFLLFSSLMDFFTWL